MLIQISLCACIIGVHRRGFDDNKHYPHNDDSHNINQANDKHNGAHDRHENHGQQIHIE